MKPLYHPIQFCGCFLSMERQPRLLKLWVTIATGTTESCRRFRSLFFPSPWREERREDILSPAENVDRCEA